MNKIFTILSEYSHLTVINQQIIHNSVAFLFVTMTMSLSVESENCPELSQHAGPEYLVLKL